MATIGSTPYRLRMEFTVDVSGFRKGIDQLVEALLPPVGPCWSGHPTCGVGRYWVSTPGQWWEARLCAGCLEKMTRASGAGSIDVLTLHGTG